MRLGQTIVFYIVCLVFVAGLDRVRAGAEPESLTESCTEFASTVDELLARQWTAADIKPAAVCSDEQFVRRVYLDLLGRIPRVSEVRDFLGSREVDRREILVDRLVNHPSHATRLTNLWRLFLLPLEDDVIASQNSAGFEAWLRERFSANVGYDQIARELILAEGNSADSGPALYYTAWELKPEKIAGSTARALLGIQIQCAECHNHPFDRWSQRDFWSYAAFFGQLQPLEGESQLPGFREVLTGEVRLPGTEEVVPPVFPGGAAADHAHQSRRQQLAEWITRTDNPYFSRAAVNRVWFLLFGRGLVDPPDDMGKHNPSPHDELLQTLSSAFQEHGYNVRWLVQTLCRTQAYQSIAAVNEDERRSSLFADMQVKVMTAEQLYDSINVAVCQPQLSGLTGPTFGMNRIVDTGRQLFLASFRSPSIGVTDYRMGIAQALMLMNGSMVDADTSLTESALLGALDAPFLTEHDQTEILFVAVLSRLPRPEEEAMVHEQIVKCAEPSEKGTVYSDLLWALLNSSEFVLNR